MFLTVSVLRIVADHDRIAGRRGLADREAAGAFGRAVGPGRVEIAVGRPGGIPGVAVIAIEMLAGEIDSAELLGLLERAILRRPIRPDEAFVRSAAACLRCFRAGERCRRRSNLVPDLKARRTATTRKGPMQRIASLITPQEP